MEVKWLELFQLPLRWLMNEPFDFLPLESNCLVDMVIIPFKYSM